MTSSDALAEPGDAPRRRRHLAADDREQHECRDHSGEDRCDPRTQAMCLTDSRGLR